MNIINIIFKSFTIFNVFFFCFLPLVNLFKFNFKLGNWKVEVKYELKPAKKIRSISKKKK